MPRKWSKRKLAQELASRLKKQFETDLEQAKEDLRWKNIKKGFNDQLEQFGRDVSRVPEAYQASWRDLRGKMPELRPDHAAGLVRQGFVSGVTQTVGQVTGESEPSPATAVPQPRKREPAAGGRDTATSRDSAYQALTTLWRPRFQLDSGQLDDLDDRAARLKQRDPDNRFTQTPHVAVIASPMAELARLLRDVERERLRRECGELTEKLGEHTWSGLPETVAAVSTDSKPSVLRACDDFFGRAKTAEDELVAGVQAAAARCRARINFDVLRAFVLSEPEGRAERCKEIRTYAGWALDLIAEIQVSGYPTQAMEKAVGACRECLNVLTVFTERQATSITVTAAAREYDQAQHYDQIYRLLAVDTKDDPTKPPADGGRQAAGQHENRRKAVELLAGKIVKSVELALNCAGPVATAFDKAAGFGEMPLVARAWGTASAAALLATRDYVDERIDDAVAKLTELTAGESGQGKAKAQAEINDDHPAWPAINRSLTGGLAGISTTLAETLTEQLDKQVNARKADIQAHLDRAAASAAENTNRKTARSPGGDGTVVVVLEQVSTRLVSPLVRVIVDNLPVTPAEPVSSAKTQTLIASLTRNFVARQVAIMDVGRFRPTRDNEGNKIECILCATPRKYAGDFEEKRERLCYDVRMSDPQQGRGYLFLDNLEFEAVPQYLGSDYADPYAELPEKDARGRRINEFIADPRALAMGPYGYKVRIGELWGYLDRYKVFTPREVDEHVLTEWRGRVLLAGQNGQGQVKAGYRSEDGELVEGNWYRPLNRGTTYFLFMPKAGSWHEWARADMPTGQASTVGKILERVTWEGVKAFRSIT